MSNTQVQSENMLYRATLPCRARALRIHSKSLQFFYTRIYSLSVAVCTKHSYGKNILADVFAIFSTFMNFDYVFGTWQEMEIPRHARGRCCPSGNRDMSRTNLVLKWICHCANIYPSFRSRWTEDSSTKQQNKFCYTVPAEYYGCEHNSKRSILKDNSFIELWKTKLSAELHHP